MKPIKKQVVIIGGGPAGLAAALKLYELGVRDMVILERESEPGGILRQCIHDGFGLTRFRETLTGPEYSHRFVEQIRVLDIPLITDATVVSLTEDRLVRAACNGQMMEFQGEAVILAMGCRERTRGALSIPGSRPAGVYTAGVAQSYVNLHNIMVGKEVVILGSGDIGLIMARRLTLEGAKVQGVYEIQPYPSGLDRNIRQCLEDFQIPLYLSHTVTDIRGTRRLEGVEVCKVDEQRRPLTQTARFIPCDTLVLSVGLIPENELSLEGGVVLDPHTKGPLVDGFHQTSVEGIFAAGNVLHVHDLVDFVSLEGEALAESVARFLKEGTLPSCPVQVVGRDPLLYTLPQRVPPSGRVELFFRVKRPVGDKTLQVMQGANLLFEKKYREVLPAEMEKCSFDVFNLKADQPLEVHLT